ncbi:MAG: aminopeptidase [Candidatus Bathyarchaeia archaeon]
MDPRVTKHAKIIVDYSTRIRKGDNVLIQISDQGLDLAVEILRQASRRGASCLITSQPVDAAEAYYKNTPNEYLKIFPKHIYSLVKASDVIISIRGEANTRSLSAIEPSKLSLRSATLEKIQEERMRKRWCLTQHPTFAYAQEADMSYSDYCDFVYSAILMDWKREAKKLTILKRFLDNSREIKLEGEGTDLTMKVNGRIFVVDEAKHNLPGGEIFTAPIEESVDGRIYFDLPAIHSGKEVKDIELEFRSGKIVSCRASKNIEFLEAMIKTDPGAARVGEFGIGTNMRINRFTRNILFDEKIGGTIHLAIGRAYRECRGRNVSAIHWDMIKTMKPGRIVVDGKVIQEDGRFIWDRISRTSKPKRHNKQE